MLKQEQKSLNSTMSHLSLSFWYQKEVEVEVGFPFVRMSPKIFNSKDPSSIMNSN